MKLLTAFIIFCLLCTNSVAFACDPCESTCTFVFNSTGTSVTVSCSKDLSNVVLNFCNGSASFKFDNLNVGQTYTFNYQNKQISKVAAKAGCTTSYKTRTCLKEDCLGVPGGSAVVDSCGVCNGKDKEKGCDGVCFSHKVNDSCGVCGGSGPGECGCNLSIKKDCFGVCGGSAVVGGCDNKCGSTKVKDCAGVCGGTSKTDSCGVCGGSGPGECGCNLSIKKDCFGVCGGSAVVGGCDNKCGSTKVKDCAGICGGTEIVDTCGVCGGSGPGECGCDLSIKKDCFDICGGSAIVGGCDNMCGSTKVVDICGVCGGDGSTCLPTPTPTPPCEVDCLGVLCGTAQYDDCGICNGAGKSLVTLKIKIKRMLRQTNSLLNISILQYLNIGKKCNPSFNTNKLAKKALLESKISITLIRNLRTTAYLCPGECSKDVNKDNKILIRKQTRKLVNIAKQTRELAVKYCNGQNGKWDDYTKRGKEIDTDVNRCPNKICKK